MIQYAVPYAQPMPLAPAPLPLLALPVPQMVQQTPLPLVPAAPAMSYGLPYSQPVLFRDSTGPSVADDEPNPNAEVPVQIVPMPFVPPNGRRRGVVVGIAYRGRKEQIKGCIVDANNMLNYLMRQGFAPQETSFLTDDTPVKPTRQNILLAIEAMVQGSSPGDVLFFYFAGHGGQAGYNPYETDELDEHIVALDGRIKDDELFQALCMALPAGVRMTVLMDCCHSGTGIDLPCHYYLKTGGWTQDRQPNYCKADVRMISGCEDSQSVLESPAGGPMTNAFLQAAESGLSHAALYQHIDRTVWSQPKKPKYHRPHFSASHPFDLNLPWDLNQILLDQSPNRNYQPGFQSQSVSPQYYSAYQNEEKKCTIM